jgi:hypothetical protein
MDSLKLTVVFLLINLTCIGQKSYVESYYNKYRGITFVLKPDSTFDYNAKVNIGSIISKGKDGSAIVISAANYRFVDGSKGTYRIINDTVFLYYSTEELKGDFNGYNIRPKKLFQHGKLLYTIDPQTVEVLKNQRDYKMLH